MNLRRSSPGAGIETPEIAFVKVPKILIFDA